MRYSFYKHYKFYKQLIEKFNMKAYNLLQIEVASLLAKQYHYQNINEFFSSSLGTQFMISFREILIKRFGRDKDQPQNPNFSEDDIKNKEEKQQLVIQIAKEINDIIKGKE